MSTENMITVGCYDRNGALVDIVEDVSLGDRCGAASQGVESLHTAALWGAIAASSECGRDLAEASGS